MINSLKENSPPFIACIASLLFIMMTFSSNAQISDRLSLDFTIARLDAEQGVLIAHLDRVSFFDGMLLKYSIDERWEPYIGIRKIETLSKGYALFEWEETHIKGAEISLGSKFTPNKGKKLRLNYGFEISSSLSRLDGYSNDDTGQRNEINHRKTTIGIGALIGLNYKLSDRVILFADTRYLIAKEYLNQEVEALSIENLYPEIEKWTFDLEPINSLGISFRL